MIKRMIFLLGCFLYFVSVALLTNLSVIISPITFILFNSSLDNNLELVRRSTEWFDNKLENFIAEN